MNLNLRKQKMERFCFFLQHIPCSSFQKQCKFFARQQLLCRLNSSRTKKTSAIKSSSQTPQQLQVPALEEFGKCQLEFTCGAGGVESMLFAGDLFSMYEKYTRRRGWQWLPIQTDRVQMGGLRSAIVSVIGANCYARLRFEGGVHRVQRIPVTDKSRIHTSTASVVVLPEPEDPEVLLDPKELRLEFIKGAGPGGANVNANPTSVRLTHLPTSISVKVMDERKLEHNKKLAFQRLSAILLQKQIDEAAKKFSSSRKLQVGSLARSEKIRTYNFKDNRVTDHRLQSTVFGVQDFLDAGEGLEAMIEALELLFMEEEEAHAKLSNTASERSQQSAIKSDGDGPRQKRRKQNESTN